MLVKEVMARSVITIDSDESVFDACMLYKKHKIGCLVVVDGDKTTGILTERDIIERCICEQKNPLETCVADIMSSNLKTVHALETLEKAIKKMTEYKIKKLPVLIKDEMVGIITVTDIYKVKPELSKRFMDSWVTADWRD